MATKSVSEELTQYRSLLTESWGTEMHTAKKDKGMFKGKSKGEIGSALSKNKKTAANDRSKGKSEPAPLKKKIKQEEFALRAKNNFGKVKESIDLNEGAGMSFEHLLKTHHQDVDAMIEGGDMSQALFDTLYEYYFEEMPYGVAKARTGDPYQWVFDRFQRDLQREGLMSDNTENLVSQAENIGEGKSHEQKDCKLCGGKLSAKACAAKLDKKKEVKESKFIPGPFSKAGYMSEGKKDKDDDPRCKCGHFENTDHKKGNCYYEESDGKRCKCRGFRKADE